MNKLNIDDQSCPLCGKKVKLIRFGGGWIGMCCNKIFYNISDPLEATTKRESGKDSDSI
jgi:hypothetical protein